VNSGDTTISDLVMLADGTVYAVGHVEGGSLYFYELLLQRWDGSSWRQEAGPPFPAYYGSRISGTSADDLWIIRPETGQTLVSHRKGGVWSTTDLSKTVWNFMPLDLDVPAPGRPWLVGCYGHSDHYSGCSSKVLEFRGGAWQPHDVPLEAQSLTARSPSEMWLVGHDHSTGQPAVAFFDGTGWTLQSLPQLHKPHGYRVTNWLASLKDVVSIGDELVAVGEVSWLDLGPDDELDEHEDDDGDDRWHSRSLLMRYSAGQWSYDISTHGPTGEQLSLALAGGEVWLTNGTSALWRLSGTRWVQELALRDTTIGRLASWPGMPTAWAPVTVHVPHEFDNMLSSSRSEYWRVN